MADNTNQNDPGKQREFNDAINDYRSLLKSISAELGAQKSHISAANDEYRKMDSIARQLQSTEEGINGLTSEQIAKLKTKYSLSVSEVGNQAKQLLSQKGIVHLTETQLKYLKEQGKLSEKEAALLKGYLEDYELEKSMTETINNKLQERIRYEERVNDLTGATGAIIDSMEGSMKALGLASMSNFLNIDAAKKAMQEEADAVARGEKEGGKMSVRMAGIKTIAEGLNKSLFSTEAIIGFIVSELAAGSQNMANLQKQTGMSYQSAYKLNTEMNAVAAGTADAFITGEKLGKAYASLTEELGVSADILGNKALVSATNLEQRLGMSAEQSSKLTVFARLQGEDTEKVLENATGTVGAFNNQNKTAINVKAVMNDVANASKATYLSMGKNVTALTQAATKAKSLGLSLKDLESISESLLDFESSIGKELEAQLLTGGNINLSKAREYARLGDLKGLGEEIGKQAGILNAFRTNDVIAQKAAADALGITREQLADMTMQQELLSLGAEKFKKQYGESAYESMKARSAAEGFGDAIEKIKSILGSIFQAFSPVLDGIVMLLNLPFVPQLLAGALAIKVISGGLFGSVKSMGSLVKGAADFAKNMNPKGMMEYLGKLKGAFGEGLGGKVQEKVADAGGGLVEKAKDKLSEKAEGAADGLVDKGLDKVQDKVGDKVGLVSESVTDASDKASSSGTGEEFKEKMQNIAEGIKAFGNKDVLFGALNLIPSSIGLVVMIPGVLGAKLIEQVKGEKFKESMLGIAEGIKAFSDKDVLLGGLGLIVASAGLVAMIPGVLGAKLLEILDGEKIQEGLSGLASGLTEMASIKVVGGALALIAASAGLTLLIPGIAGGLLLAATAIPISAGLNILGVALASFGVLMAGGGLLGVGALALAAISLGVALNIAAPGIEAFGTVITAAFGGLATMVTAVANGFVTMMGAVTMDNIAPMLLLGPALFGIAAGLTAVAIAGPMAIPALLAVGAVTGVASVVLGGGSSSVGESKSKAEEGSLAEVSTKLETLIQVVRQGGNIYMDGKHIAHTVNRTMPTYVSKNK